MIVMGISGKSGLEKLLIGSTTVQMQRTSGFPLLMVPNETLIGNAVSTIVFTTDLKGFSIVQENLLREFLDAFLAVLFRW
jgi:hypothetical protein